MKYTQHIGVLASLLVIGICFLPWVEVPSLHLVLNGLNAKINENLSFGNQWKGHAFFAIIMIFSFPDSKDLGKKNQYFLWGTTFRLGHQKLFNILYVPTRRMPRNKTSLILTRFALDYNVNHDLFTTNRNQVN